MRVLLNPTLRIGSLVQLDSTINLIRYGFDSNSISQNFNNQVSLAPNARGLYYVMVANHSGETRGNPWYTDLVCPSVDATITPAVSGLINQTAVFPASAINRF